VSYSYSKTHHLCGTKSGKSGFDGKPSKSGLPVTVYYVKKMGITWVASKVVVRTVVAPQATTLQDSKNNDDNDNETNKNQT
jgi:hypothetical protein